MPDVTEYDELRDALDRADRIINWMAPYIGKMCTPPDGIFDLNEHWMLMERLNKPLPKALTMPSLSVRRTFPHD